MNYTAASLLDIHRRAHRSIAGLIAHCAGELDEEQVDRSIAGFGVPTIRQQLLHVIGAERYWIGVLEDKMLTDDPVADYPTVASLEEYRAAVAEATEEYLRNVSPTTLNEAAPMTTWGRTEKRSLVPAHVIMRPVTHAFHHQGQVVAMCRLLGKPCNGLDYPLE